MAKNMAFNSVHSLCYYQVAGRVVRFYHHHQFRGLIVIFLLRLSGVGGTDSITYMDGDLFQSKPVLDFNVHINL